MVARITGALYLSSVLYLTVLLARAETSIQIFGGGVCTEDRTECSWEKQGVLGDNPEDIQLVDFGDDKSRRIFHIECSCTDTAESTDFLLFRVYQTSTKEVAIISNPDCDTATVGVDVVAYSRPDVFNGVYNLMISGNKGLKYHISVVLELTDMKVVNGKGEGNSTISKNEMVVKSFDIAYEDIISDSSRYSYIQIAVNSTDKYVVAGDRLRYSARLMVTQDPDNLALFFQNPEGVIPGAIRLSFSTFGMITISNASHPRIDNGTWFVGLAIKHAIMPKITGGKDVVITVNTVVNYDYKGKIAILFLASLLGIIIPLLERLIFDADHLHFRGFKLKFWRTTMWNWFWSGKKGLTYLTALLACLLIVSAFQVVHAKYDDMITSGDRDTCFYNEKCYRPYGKYYDVSVNNIASNLPFMVHGVILVVYFSFAEAFCRSNQHKYFDYSIPYSFGLAFICEGFGSLLYHICPSQIIFQFDTLFMFVITIIMIIGIFEGYAIRENDVKYSTVAKHKTIRIPKVFAFFVGPVYFFNFIGNLISTQGSKLTDSPVKIFGVWVQWHGLPTPFIICFYIVFALWWILILGWAAYKLDLLPDALDPKTQVLPKTEELETHLQIAHDNIMFKSVAPHRKTLKSIGFIGYCVLVFVGYIGALLRKVPFSLFILGVLVVAVIALTLVFFIPLMWVLLKYTFKIPVYILKSTKYTVSKHFLVIFGVTMYVLIGCAITGVSLLFFSYFNVTDKSVAPWKSREQNAECFLNGFYDTHDFWHLFASFALMFMAMLNVQISKPCRDCYLLYLSDKDKRIRRMTMKTERTGTGQGGVENPNFTVGSSNNVSEMGERTLPQVQDS